MTRKRYVKLLMAKGYSRNEANAKAKVVVEKGGVYASEYYEQFNIFADLCRLIYPLVTVDLSGLNETMRRAAESAERISEKLAALFADLGGRVQRYRLK